jgi:hypothetical protein
MYIYYVDSTSGQWVQISEGLKIPLEAIPPTEPEPEPTPQADFFVTNDGFGAYLIDGISNDTITLLRGETYIFEIQAIGHPFWIQSVPSPYSESDIYNEGVSNNGIDSGFIEWTVDELAPSTLYYVCQFHPAMSGTIVIIGNEEEYDEYLS